MSEVDRLRQQRHRKKRKEEGEQFTQIRLSSERQAQVARAAEVLKLDIKQRGALQIVIDVLLGYGFTSLFEQAVDDASEIENEIADQQAKAVRDFADQMLLRLFLEVGDNAQLMVIVRRIQQAALNDVIPQCRPLDSPLMYD